MERRKGKIVKSENENVAYCKLTVLCLAPVGFTYLPEFNSESLSVMMVIAIFVN